MYNNNNCYYFNNLGRRTRPCSTRKPKVLPGISVTSGGMSKSYEVRAKMQHL